MIERSIGTGGLLRESFSEITVIMFYFFEVFQTLVLPSLLFFPLLFSFTVVFFCGRIGFFALHLSLDI